MTAAAEEEERIYWQKTADVRQLHTLLLLGGHTCIQIITEVDPPIIVWCRCNPCKYTTTAIKASAATKAAAAAAPLELTAPKVVE